MEVNIPAKLLRASVSSMTAIDEWPFDDGQGDPFWAGGTNPKPYRWRLVMSITSQSHSSHLTRKPNEYNGLDAQVGDWIAGSQTGIALKIISIESKTETTMTCIVEDVIRYNTFRSTTGSGIFSVPGTALIFQINENGDPVLDPIPTGFVSDDFYINLESRFKAYTLQRNFLIEQVSHGFNEGDVIAIDGITQQFELAESDSLDRVVGTVSAAGPGPNFFLLRPTTRVVENFEPALPGAAGDFIYSDPSSPGDLTTIRSGPALFLQLTDPIPTILRTTVPNGSTTTGNAISINGVTVTFTTGTGTIDDVVFDINTLTGSHGVVASKIFTPVSITTSASDLVYGQIGAFTDPPGPASATINGTTVTFSTQARGEAAFALNVAIQGDMAFDINNANISGIEATFDSSTITLTELDGGSITIVNVNSDTNGNPWAGLIPDSCTGLPLSASANTDELIKLTRADGGEIIIQNEIGDPVGDFGFISGHNGRLPLGLVVEQGIRTGDMYVVANTTARDALTVLVGDQAFVLDKGDGEWGLFLWDGTQWLVTSTEESAEVDSASASFILTPSTPFGTNVIKEINDESRVTMVTVDVQTPFDGGATVEIGDSGDTGRLMGTDENDLTIVDVYATTPSHHYTTGSDVDILLNFSGGATTGLAVVTITYS